VSAVGAEAGGLGDLSVSGGVADGIVKQVDGDSSCGRIGCYVVGCDEVVLN
jgi:hypothetical protein